MNTKIGTLSAYDFLKGLLVSMLTTTITMVYTCLEAGSIKFDWHTIGVASLCSGVGYIIKQLLTDENGQIIGQKKPV